MEVYLNVAETGLGTYGVNAASQRYFGHDASAMSATEAARIAAVLPLPKERGAVAPKGFTRRYGNTIAKRIGTVRRDGLDACVYKGIEAPPERTPETTRGSVRPGEEYETARPLPPLEDPVPVTSDAPAATPAEQEPLPPPETQPPPQPAPGFPPPPNAQEPATAPPEQEPPPPPAAT